jgi:hypothetical protein
MKKIDLINKRFGRLTVIKDTGEINNKYYPIWLCRCDCGNTCKIPIHRVMSGNTKSCGCISNIINLTGRRFGRLVVIKNTNKKTNDKSIIWLCKCDCGKEKEINGSSLRKGSTKSCGCLQKEVASNNGYEDRTLSAFNVLYGNYEHGAKNRNLEFNLTKEQFGTLTKQICFYCGFEPNQISKCNTGIYVYNGIDRLDNNIGYEIDNCVPCCGYCNAMKRAHTQEEFMNKVKSIYDNLKNKGLIK